jgi:hypothetical protein
MRGPTVSGWGHLRCLNKRSMTTPAEWQNTGTFGPEQADLDVAYATPCLRGCLGMGRSSTRGSSIPLREPGHEKKQPLPHLPPPKSRLVPNLVVGRVILPFSKSERDPYRYPVRIRRKTSSISLRRASCFETLRWRGRSCGLGLTLNTRPCEGVFGAVGG